MNPNLNITPKTKIGELLDAFPQLEATLIALSPEFSKLKNPILRKTIAKIATLQQAAVMAKLSVDILVNKLREAAGQLKDPSIDSEEKTGITEKPDWLEEDKITSVFNAIPNIIAGGHPMPVILAKAGEIKGDEIFEFHTPFIPAPLIEVLSNKGYLTYSVEISSNFYKNYVRRS